MISLPGLSEPDLHQLAADIAIASRPGDCIALSGELGAGKTSFSRAFIRFLAGADIDVPSPTFTLVQQYAVAAYMTIHHFDFYRIADPDEVIELGLDEALATGLALIEWPEKVPDAIPADATRIIITPATGDSERRDVGIDTHCEAIRQSLAVRHFLNAHGAPSAARAHMTGDASTRRYETIDKQGERQILMIAPRQPDGPPVRDGKPYSQLAHLAEDIVPFIAIGSTLEARGFRAPHIRGFDLGEGFMLLEDLGPGKIVDDGQNPIATRYEAAVKCLVALHEQPWSPDLAAGGLHHTLPPFDENVFVMEASLLPEWYVPAETGRQLADDMIAEFNGILRALWGQLDTEKYTILLRDFHSPNIIFDASRRGVEAIGLIDFQDALWGPGAYDVMSLVHDARVTIPDSLGADLVTAYCAARKQTNSKFDETRFRREAAICTAQRLCKILGIFHRLNKRDGKPAYLAYLPRVRGYLQTALDHDALHPLADWWARAGLGGPSS
ncbi:MAG: tRNA (adenosine(37)-N6)-threonylcarbamoyltransferase complex ATPase subunit type 1 TsaE [Pseudomonadota bacterium]